MNRPDDNAATRKHVTRWAIVLFCVMAVGVVFDVAALARTGRVDRNTSIIERIIQTLKDNGMWSEP